MDAVVTIDLDQLKSWLDELQIAFYECDSCQALHLPHLQYINGIFDAKIDVLKLMCLMMCLFLPLLLN